MIQSALRGAAAGAAAGFATGAIEVATTLPAAFADGVVSGLAALAAGLGLAALIGGAAALIIGAGAAAASAARAERATPAALHGAAVAAALFTAATAATVAALVARFRDPALIGLVAAVLALPWLAGAAAAGGLIAAALRGRRLLPARRAELDPLANRTAALVLWLALLWIAVAIALPRSLVLRNVFPLRLAASLTLFALLCGEAARRLGRPGRRALVAAAIVTAAGAAALATISGAGARRALLGSPALALAADGLRLVTDVDGDGYGSLLGGGDCRPFDGAIHPGARERPGDGIDQNCSGADYRAGAPPSPWPDTPLPDARRGRSLLLVTIDTLRYDHVGFAGYRRPTTPQLDALAARAAWFERAYSTGSATKVVLPTLVASRQMAELPLGARIGDGSPKMPEALGEATVTLAEVLAAAGFRTALFTAHYYFDGWGVGQGFASHLNLPWQGAARPTAAELTDAALAWLDGQPADARWFLWIHYYDPHLPYVAHAGEPGFGDGEVDRYDGELRHVDAQLGRLLARVDAATVVMVASDHGEELGERGRFGHYGGLDDYLLHIPLVVAIPGGPARRVSSPASLLDLAPTAAALLGVAPDPSWTGRALIAELTGAPAPRDRVVFAVGLHGRTFAALAAAAALRYDAENNLYDGDPALRGVLTDFRERLAGAELSP